jgi:hypothetical protein
VSAPRVGMRVRYVGEWPGLLWSETATVLELPALIGGRSLHGYVRVRCDDAITESLTPVERWKEIES